MIKEVSPTTEVTFIDVEFTKVLTVELPIETTLLKYPRFAETEVAFKTVAPPEIITKLTFWNVEFPRTVI